MAKVDEARKQQLVEAGLIQSVADYDSLSAETKTAVENLDTTLAAAKVLSQEKIDAANKASGKK